MNPGLNPCMNICVWCGATHIASKTPQCSNKTSCCVRCSTVDSSVDTIPDKINPKETKLCQVCREPLAFCEDCGLVSLQSSPRGDYSCEIHSNAKAMRAGGPTGPIDVCRACNDSNRSVFQLDVLVSGRDYSAVVDAALITPVYNTVRAGGDVTMVDFESESDSEVEDLSGMSDQTDTIVIKGMQSDEKEIMKCWFNPETFTADNADTFRLLYMFIKLNPQSNDIETQFDTLLSKMTWINETKQKPYRLEFVEEHKLMMTSDITVLHNFIHLCF